jgi:nucleotide-binding universal stress UspA family protein
MPYTAEYLESVKNESEAKLKDLCDRITKQGVECDYINEMRTIGDLITETEKVLEPLLIIMGTKGAGKLKGALMGTHASWTIAHASCPVLTVPEKAVFKPIAAVTYATNYEDKDAENIGAMLKLLKPFKPLVTVLHVSQDGLSDEVENEELNLLADRVHNVVDYDPMRFQLIYGKYLEKTFDAYVKRERPDLLVMSSHKRGLLDRLFGKSNTRSRAYHTTVPLLSFHY